MLPGLLHPPSPIRFILPQEPQGVEGKKTRILLAAVVHPLIHPDNAGLRVLKHGLLFRAVENLTPDTFYRGSQQDRFGIEIIVDRPHRYAAGGGNRANAER